jgi:hypothetical protein
LTIGGRGRKRGRDRGLRKTKEKGVDMRKRTFITAVLLAAFMALGQAALAAQTRLEPYLEIELKRLEETYRLMETYAQTYLARVEQLQ